MKYIPKKSYSPKRVEKRRLVVNPLMKPALFVALRRTNNNLFLSVAHRGRRPLYQASAGSIGLSGSRRDSPTSAELAGRTFTKEVKNRGYTLCYLRVNGRFDTCVRAALRGLYSTSKIIFTKFDWVKPMSHNGLRLKKPRRM